MPYYENQDQLTLPYQDQSFPYDENEYEEVESVTYDLKKPLTPIQRNFLEDLGIENNDVFLYKKKMVRKFFLI